MTHRDLFFEFVFVKASSEPFTLSNRCTVTAADVGYAADYAQRVLAGLSPDGETLPVTLTIGIPDHIRASAGNLYADNDESYALAITRERIDLYGASRRGLIYAVSTLLQLVEADAVCEMVLFDYPDKSFRGYRVYTPGRDHFDDFKRVVDMMVYYKYNAINLEVGGAMEYKRHPEINEKWVEFCAEVHQSPYEAHRIQFETHPQWQKNSIHADNGDGGFITQDEMRGLIAYCRERELLVVPEVPTLSHCDYIVMAHPEIREREADTYPDTYCPSDPRSYELVFDILEEVIDVFQPQYMNIGHDECYTLAKCEKCKNQDPVDLYVGDIVKINDFLRARGIRALMWSEKFIDNVYLPEPDGTLHGYGGTGDPAWDVPRVIGCVGKVPKDVILLHWYWSLCEGAREKELCDMGYTMLYGNFSAARLDGYRSRIGRVEGGFISNWGSFEEQYMQRNGQNYNLLSTSWILWNHNFDDSMRAPLRKKVAAALYDRHVRSLGSEVIEITHTTDHDRPYKVFYDGFFIVPEDWIIGRHIVTYHDGTEAELPVMFGWNIRSAAESGTEDSNSTEAVETSYIEVLGATFPQRIDGKMWYRTAYRNPHPEKTIVSIRTQANDGITIDVMA